MISKGFGLIAFFANVKASSVCNMKGLRDYPDRERYSRSSVIEAVYLHLWNQEHFRRYFRDKLQ